MPKYLRDDGLDEVMSKMLDVVSEHPPPMPAPGHQADWDAVLSGEASQQSLEHEASVALRRRIDRGAATDDLYSLTKGIRALAIADVLRALDPDGEGELAGEFFGAYLELPSRP